MAASSSTLGSGCPLFDYSFSGRRVAGRCSGSAILTAHAACSIRLPRVAPQSTTVQQDGLENSDLVTYEKAPGRSTDIHFIISGDVREALYDMTYEGSDGEDTQVRVGHAPRRFILDWARSAPTALTLKLAKAADLESFEAYHQPLRQAFVKTEAYEDAPGLALTENWYFPCHDINLSKRKLANPLSGRHEVKITRGAETVVEWAGITDDDWRWARDRLIAPA